MDEVEKSEGKICFMAQFPDGRERERDTKVRRKTWMENEKDFKYSYTNRKQQILSLLSNFTGWSWEKNFN
jgi:hypothetical protein